MVRVLIGLVVVVLVVTPGRSLGQAPKGTSSPASTTTALEATNPQPGTPLGDALVDLPVGPLPPPLQPPPGVPGPYFVQDPLLDPPQLPPPGWFAEAGVSGVNPHVRYWSNLSGPITRPNGTVDTPSIPGAHLDWAASPELMLGYRLPAGFGEFLVTYREMASQGTETLPIQQPPTPSGPSTVHSRLDMNVADFDYRSSEISGWPWLDMKWWAGGRFINLFFDSRQSPTPAPSGTGSIYAVHVSNRFVGFGPHAGGELDGFLHGRTWSLTARVEGTYNTFGRITQNFSESFSPTQTYGSAFSSSQSVPILDAQIGLRYMPSPRLEIFFGYQYEYIWNAARENNVPIHTTNTSGTMGEVYDSAIVLRASYTF